MKREGAKSRNEIVTWGFIFEDIKKSKGGYRQEVSTWANQNCSNLCIDGEEGELEHLLAHFPELIIEGEYADEYEEGQISQSERC